MAELVIDLATESDIPALEAHIRRSAQALCARHYPPDAVKAAIRHVFGVDSQLVHAGCYYIARVRDQIIACGGWSPFATLFGADHMAGRNDRRLDPSLDAARIRAFFVCPNWTRVGVGSALLETCETAALEAGFASTRLMATLSGVPFYEARGYAAEKDYVASFDDTDIRFVPMHKALHAGWRPVPSAQPALAAH